MRVEEEVLRIAEDILQTRPGILTLESSPESVEGWDSAQHLTLILALEQHFAVEFLPEEFDQTRSIDQIVALLQQKAR